jgi:hypothetical protein
MGDDGKGAALGKLLLELTHGERGAMKTPYSNRAARLADPDLAPVARSFRQNGLAQGGS